MMIQRSITCTHGNVLGDFIAKDGIEDIYKSIIGTNVYTKY